MPIEISPEKLLFINENLNPYKQQQLVHVLQTQPEEFSWTYTDMKGIHSDTCIHHIYTQENIRPVR